MSPAEFPEANCRYGPPPDLAETQCGTVLAYRGQVERGSVEDAPLVVVAWKPDALDLQRIIAGQPVFLSVIGGLPPHFLTTDFQSATHPA